MFVSLSVIAMGKRKVSVLQKKKKFKILKCVEVLQTYITLVKLNKSNIAQLKMSLMSMKCFFNPAMIHKSSRLRIPSHSEVQAELA